MTAAGVMVAIGHHVYPSMATFPGMEDFEGTVMHSHSFKDFKGLENKRALVVGVGNSGIDVAVELSNANTKVGQIKTSSHDPVTKTYGARATSVRIFPNA